MNVNLLRNIFYSSLHMFFENESQNISDGVSERNLCARLACILEKNAYDAGISNKYVADVEYNRKQDAQLKTIINDKLEVIKITCDLILHSRGVMGEHDNLITIEMKKENGTKKTIISDNERLAIMTRVSFDGVWSWNGYHPKHVCGYKIGFFIQLDRINKTCKIIEYIAGHKNKTNKITYA